MRRHDREVTDPEEIDRIIGACMCCRLGFNDGGEVYIVPLNFGYERRGETRRFYFHGAREGRKIRLIGTGCTAGFELDTGCTVREAPAACGYTAAFRSVVGTGRVTLLGGEAERLHALERIMLHYTGRQEWSFSEAMLRAVAVFCLEVTALSCKVHV